MLSAKAQSKAETKQREEMKPQQTKRKHLSEFLFLYWTNWDLRSQKILTTKFNTTWTLYI